jgi:glutathione synthase/RimK-type ligase-like ATP-grasp enzyme
MILVVSPKNAEATKLLVEAAHSLQIPMDVFDVQELAAMQFEVDFSKYKVLYIRQVHPYYKEIIQFAQDFKSLGKKVVDGSIAGGWLEVSKKYALDSLKKAMLLTPRTLWLEEALPAEFPFMLKWEYGFGGTDTHYIKDNTDLLAIVGTHEKPEWLWQEYIPAEHEYKVITVGYKSLPKILKFEYSEHSHRPDFGKWKAVDVSSEPNVVHLAETASRILQRELAKTDILQRDGDYYILEVNRSPGLDQYTSLTGINVAKEFIWYLVE